MKYLVEASAPAALSRMTNIRSEAAGRLGRR